MSILTRLQKLEQVTNEQNKYIIIRQPGETRAQAFERNHFKVGDEFIFIDIGYDGDLPTASD